MVEPELALASLLVSLLVWRSISLRLASHWVLHLALP
jgi:hypothetical protein